MISLQSHITETFLINELLNEFLNEHSPITENLNSEEFDELVDKVTGWFKLYAIDFRFTEHLLDRLNDSRNKPTLTKDELLKIFDEIADELGMVFMKNKEVKQAVIKYVKSDINIPVVLKAGQVYIKTIQRKKKFFTKQEDTVYTIK